MKTKQAKHTKTSTAQSLPDAENSPAEHGTGAPRFKSFKFSRLQAALFVSIFAGIGGLIIWRALAAPANCPVLSTAPPPGYCTGTIYYVSSSSGSDTAQGTQSAPFKTIDKAGSVIRGGDVVVVENGVYTDINNDTRVVSLNRGGTASSWVTFVSLNKWGAKIDGQSFKTYDGINFSAGASFIRVEGFDIYGLGNITGGAHGFGIYSGGSNTQIVGNHIHNIGQQCVSSSNSNALAGMSISQPNVVVENNVFHDFGRFSEGENGCTYTNAYWENHDHGIYLNGGNSGVGNVVIRNNIFYNVKHGWAIQAYPGALNNVDIVNNSFAFGNPNRYNEFIVLNAIISDMNIQNNIFYDPSPSQTIRVAGSNYDAINISNNITSGASMTEGSPPAGFTLSGNKVNTNAQLTNPPTDMSIKSTSPAINSGLTLSLVTNDFNNGSRPQGVAYDIGAYEFGSTPSSTPPPPPSPTPPPPTPTPPPPPPSPAPTLSLGAVPTSITAGGSSTLSWSATNATSCTASGGWSGSKSVSSSQTVTPTTTATYTLACNGSGGSVTKSVTVTVTPVTTTPSNLSITQSIASGSTLSGSVKWEAFPVGATITKVEFFVDGAYKWMEDTTPFIYQGNSGKLDTKQLNNDSHEFKVVTTSSDGKTAASSVTAKVDNSSSSSTPSASGNGLSAVYYDNENFSGKSVSRIDSIVNMNLGRYFNCHPASGIGCDTFSVRWTGRLLVPSTGTYHIMMNSDDGVNVWINDKLVIDHWANHKATYDTATVSLTAGTYYNIRIDYHEHGGHAVAQLYWNSPTIAQQIIPQKYLFSK